MKFGICTNVEQSVAVKAAGWDFVEESIQGLLKGQAPDEQWDGASRIRNAAVPVPAANMLVPASLKITGPAVNPEALRAYMANVLRRAGQIGCTTLVFGSGGARNVPDGFDRTQAKQQIIQFIRDAVPVAQQHGVTLVCEPLNRSECNIINTVGEAMEYVRAIDHPNFQCLVDSYHFWLENDSLESLRQAMPWLRHVHVADRDGRVAPGLSGTSDYVPFFRVLKQAGYDRMISFEGTAMKEFEPTAPKVLKYLKDAWQSA